MNSAILKFLFTIIILKGTFGLGLSLAEPLTQMNLPKAIEGEIAIATNGCAACQRMCDSRNNDCQKPCTSRNETCQRSCGSDQGCINRCVNKYSKCIGACIEERNQCQRRCPSCKFREGQTGMVPELGEGGFLTPFVNNPDCDEFPGDAIEFVEIVDKPHQTCHSGLGQQRLVNKHPSRQILVRFWETTGPSTGLVRMEIKPKKDKFIGCKVWQDGSSPNRWIKSAWLYTSED